VRSRPTSDDFPVTRLQPAVRRVQLVFEPDVDMSDVAETLELSRLAADALYGPERMALEASWRLDRPSGTVVIDTSTAPGRAVATIFLGYARREFGEQAVRVTRAGTAPRPGREVR